MVDKGGDWTFGEWYKAEPKAVHTFKGWETSGKVAELAASSTRQAKGDRLPRRSIAHSRLRALRSERVNLNHCFKHLSSSAESATLTAVQPTLPVRKRDSRPGAHAHGEATAAARHFLNYA